MTDHQELSQQELESKLATLFCEIVLSYNQDLQPMRNKLNEESVFYLTFSPILFSVIAFFVIPPVLCFGIVLSFFNGIVAVVVGSARIWVFAIRVEEYYADLLLLVRSWLFLPNNSKSRELLALMQKLALKQSNKITFIDSKQLLSWQTWPRLEEIPKVRMSREEVDVIAHNCLFVSHKWYADAPDNAENAFLKEVQRTVKENQNYMNKVKYIWIDFLCADTEAPTWDVFQVSSLVPGMRFMRFIGPGESYYLKSAWCKWEQCLLQLGRLHYQAHSVTSGPSNKNILCVWDCTHEVELFKESDWMVLLMSILSTKHLPVLLLSLSDLDSDVALRSIYIFLLSVCAGCSSITTIDPNLQRVVQVRLTETLQGQLTARF